jgi:hypothetical protein
MEYKYGKNLNYEDFSSGRVLYHKKGVTNFPIRLASEIFGRCLQYTDKDKVVPYGDLVFWEGEEANPVDVLLSRLMEISYNQTIVGISMDKKQKATGDRYLRLEKHLVGKRKFEILKRKEQ